MSETYTTGKFAKKCSISERALRLYDKKGLLVPKVNPENGYRYYQNSDMIRLQKILMFKKLGFSLEEIAVLLARDNKSVIEALKEQRILVHHKIQEYKNLDEVLKKTIQKTDLQKDTSWAAEVLASLNRNSQLVLQYKNADNLSTRISLHDKYSQNPVGWFEWLFEQISFFGVNRFLEVGCGNGALWKERSMSFRHREICLSDISDGMIADTRTSLGDEDFRFMVFDMMQIPFQDAYFDGIAANHLLFYLDDVQAGIQELARVCKPEGTLYASTYGRHHMQEISQLVKEFDEQIVLSDQPLYEVFGIENGQEMLEKYFEEVEFRPYEDCLIVDDASDLADYILSCHGNQIERIMPRYEEFLSFLKDKLEEEPLKITKEAGVFVAKRPLLQHHPLP